MKDSNDHLMLFNKLNSDSTNAGRYDDIISLPHHRSSTHPPLGEAERAAQFSPFAALTGYEDIVAETAQQTKEAVLHEIERLR